MRNKINESEQKLPLVKQLQDFDSCHATFDIVAMEMFIAVHSTDSKCVTETEALLCRKTLESMSL